MEALLAKPPFSGSLMTSLAAVRQWIAPAAPARVGSAGERVRNRAPAVGAPAPRAPGKMGYPLEG